MNKKEAIESIKQATKAISLLFSANKEDEKAEVKLEAVKLKQGDTMVDVQGELAEGTNVVTSSSEGAVNAVDGQYDLSNGQSFTTKGGKIDKVISDGKNEDASKADEKLADDSNEDMTDAPAAVDTDNDASEDASNTAALQALADKITEMDSMISAIKDALAGKASKQDMSAMGEQFTAIQSAFEVLADTPTEFSKIDKSAEAKEEKYKRLEALAAIANKI